MKSQAKNKDLKIVVYDLFAGAGGDTEGIEQARYKRKKIAGVIAAINHDNLALESHAMNHRRVRHFAEDIRLLDLTRLPKIKNRENVLVAIFAGLECTHHSNARGGLPRDPDSRTLANELFRYADHIDPDVIFIENVKEFRSWGPLVPRIGKFRNFFEDTCKEYEGKYCPLRIDKKTGRLEAALVPESRTKGRDYLRWREEMCSRGYHYDSRLLNAANYGGHTSRIRYFGIFAREGLRIAFPKATHSRKGGNGLRKWLPVRGLLDLENEGQSIFGREKPLVDNTLKRILAGLKKYVPEHENRWVESLRNCSWMVKYYNHNGKEPNKGPSLDEPSPTILTRPQLAIAYADFLQYYYSNGSNIGDINSPLGTITTKDRSARVVVQFIDKRYGSGDHNHQGLEDPASAITTIPKLAVVTAVNFLDKQYRSDANHQSLDQPSATITTNPKLAFVTASRFIMPTNYDNSPTSLDRPVGTVTANRKWQYLVNPQYQSPPASLDRPCFTLIAGMGKKPPCLVVTEEGYAAIRIDPEDTQVMREIKFFMAGHGIVDIKMRMLTVDELKRITGLPDDYVLLGTQEQQKKFIGNAVPPILAKCLIEAFYEANINPPRKQSLNYGLFAA